MTTEYVERSTAIISRIEGLERVPHAVIGEIRPLEETFAVDRAVAEQLGWEAR